jgi:hypothetical protein
MIANARMYSLLPAAGVAWRALFDAISQSAGGMLSYVEQPAAHAYQ